MTVIFATSAASATCAIVTSSNPREMNNRVAASEIACRVRCFLNPRSTDPPYAMLNLILGPT
ncbi:hypothetical protein GCM10022380_85640 [Amycolatopsis tucumanensis]|uniref:Secreted protein n=1 Tax=Amycolatopsis tucumanensis TaxID=401106 RepID=A0ABP7JTV5_9PSEU